MKPKQIGIDVQPQKKECKDDKCPFHGNLKVRGKIVIGKVINSKIHRSITIESQRKVLVPKYERYEKKKNKITCS